MKSIPTLALLLLLVISPAAVMASEPDNTLILTTVSNAGLKAISDALQTRLQQQSINSRVLDTTDLDVEQLGDARLYVAVGTVASELAESTLADRAVLSIRSGAERDIHDKHALLQLDQPLCRQVRMIEGLSADFSSVSIITGKLKLQSSIAACNAITPLQLMIVEPRQDESVNSMLARALEADVLLATPDINIYNRRSIKNVLLLSYRKRIPVIGFSRSFVDAGALASIYSTPQQIAEQAWDIIRYFYARQVFASDVFAPVYFSLSFNRQVSKSMAIDLPDEQKLLDSIIAGEGDD